MIQSGFQAFYIKLFPLEMHRQAYAKSITIVCERSKSLQLLEDNFEGKPLPNTNFACRQAKIALGVRMPSIKKRVWASMKMEAMQMSPEMHHALEEAQEGD